MLRRLVLLAALLLTLSVIAPAVQACEPDDGCCPSEQAPCEPVVAEVAGCCAEQPLQAVISATARELESLDLWSPSGAAPGLPVPTPVQRHSTHSPAVSLPRRPDQGQLYLHTGRLRL
jgi:hypothetical protein